MTCDTPEDGQAPSYLHRRKRQIRKATVIEWIVRAARKNGLAGATVLRRLEGLGAHSRLHAAKILRLSTDLPILIEIVDETEKIERFMSVIDGTIGEGMATLESVDVRFYRSGKAKIG